MAADQQQETGTAPGAQVKIVLVTGPSGAGRKTTINALEDLGFEAIDNLPLTLLPRLLAGPPMARNLALGVDVRNRDFSTEALIEAVDVIDRDPDFDCTLVYLDCRTEVLLRRYSETRRRHPLAPHEPPLGGIERETALLGGLRDRADILIDTSDLSPHDLRRELAGWFGGDGGIGMALALQSFSYRRGLPRGLDMVLDCRFLRNPHWQPKLRPMTGRDREVAEHVAGDPLYPPFAERVQALLELLLPAYRDEGKTSFSLGLGCTGGQHRSVFVAEELAKTLAQQGWQVSIRHRELEPRSQAASRV